MSVFHRMIALCTVATSGIVIKSNDSNWLSKYLNRKSNKHTGGGDSKLSKQKNEDVDVQDIIVVGAGPSGLLTTFLLKKHAKYSNKKVLLLEKFNRSGGRAFSTKIQHNNSQLCLEHGAMRFQSSHKHFMKLLDYFGLQDETQVLIAHSTEQVPSEKKIVVNRRNVNIGGDRPLNSVYNFNESESEINEKAMFSVLLEKMNKAIMNENNLSEPPMTEEEQIKCRSEYTYKGIPLYKWGMRPFLKEIGCSFEFIELLARSYPLGDWNKIQVAEFYCFFLTMVKRYLSENLLCLKNGMQTVPNKLYDNIKDNVVLNTNIKSIEKENDTGIYVLKSDNGNIFKCHKIILCIPAESLKYLFDSGVKFLTNEENDKLYHLLNSIQTGMAYKVNLIYDDDFWQKNNLLNYVESSSDQPINQLVLSNSWTDNNMIAVLCYIWGNDSSMYWDQLQNIGQIYKMDKSIKILQGNYTYNKKENGINGNIYIASDLVVAQARSQLKNVLGIDFPMPLAAFVTKFGDHKNNLDGWDSWAAGCIQDYVLENIFHPIKQEDIYIASSSYSVMNGWQEGAYWAATQNLKLNFGIDSPLALLE